MPETKIVLNYPVKQINISQPFGLDNTNHPQRSEFYKLFDNKHPGVDFVLPEDSEIFAAFPGIVVRKEFHQGMGNVIATRYGNIYVLYAHLNESQVDLGDVVNQGDLIALSGNTGKATTAPHLHFELRDLSERELSKMVFEPIFNSPFKNLTEQFTYTVNNNSIPKTWNLLSERYFGSANFVEKLKGTNPQIQIASSTGILPDQAKIEIPSYK